MELTEKFLHHIWDQRHLAPDLLTVSGKPVRVVYQGQYNTGNGPDFRNVVLELAGETLRGDVEIHQKTYDWSAHGHQEDPAYNGTILHVVFEHKSNLDFTIREDAGKTEILELRNQIDNDIARLFENYTAIPVLPNSGICDYFTLNTNEQLVIMLKNLGWDRILRKCERFNAELHFDGFDQILYNGFMEAMGYSKNKFNMLSIAYHYKWDTLVKWRKEGLDKKTLSAVWINYSGLGDVFRRLSKAESYINYLATLDKQGFSTEKENLDWNLFRIRPASHPVRRINQAASVIITLLDKGFIKSLLNLFNSNSEEKNSKVVERICELLRPNVRELDTTYLIGRTQMLSIIGNIILPIMHLYAVKTNDKDMQDKIKSVCMDFPPLDSNYISKFMSGYMGEVQKKLFDSKFILQQGVMQLYFRFCNFRLCESCNSSKDLMISHM
jgi:hypothetical protein